MKKIFGFLLISTVLSSLAGVALADNAGFGVTLPNPLCLSGEPTSPPYTCSQHCDNDAWKTDGGPDAPVKWSSFKDCCDGYQAVIKPTPPPCIENFPSFLATIGDYITTIIASLAVVVFIWAGFLFVTSAGNPGKIESAKKAAIYAAIGIAIALGGKGLIDVIKAVLKIQ